MYAEERHAAIAVLVAQRGRLAVSEMAQRFGVTTETVRRDLAALERTGVLRRVHGGAVRSAVLTSIEPDVAERDGAASAAKDRIARAALAQLPAGEGSVLLDGGTTTGRLATVLPADSRLVVVTSSVPISARLAAMPGIELQVVGGRVRGTTQTTVGATALHALQDLRVDVAVLGANGMDVEHGFSTPDSEEAAVKRAMVASGQRVVLLADSTKIGRSYLHRFARPQDVDVLVTDDGLAPEDRAALERAGVEVVIA